MGHLAETMERIRAERIAQRTFPNNLNKRNDNVDDDKNRRCNEDIKETKETKEIKEIKEIKDIGELLIELKRNEPTSDNQFFRLAILAYEIGDLNRSIVYAERFRDDEKARIAHLAHGKLAMADALTQLYLLCISLGWDFDKLRELGVQHLKERQQDFRIQGWVDIK